VFTAHDSWWWVPVAGPLIGAVIGGYAYDWLIPSGPHIAPPVEGT
jgi:glycerol uptake facilitator-like aquaporin